MKQISTLYKDEQHFQDFLVEEDVNRKTPCVARVVTSNLLRHEVRALTQMVKRLLPNASIIGMTSSTAVIHKSKIEEGQTLISLEYYDSLTLTYGVYDYKDVDYKELSEKIYHTHKESSEKQTTVHILINSSFHYITELLEELNNLEKPLHLAGAVVGIMPENDEGYIFDEFDIYDDKILTYALDGASERHYTACNVSYEVVEDTEHEITVIDHDTLWEVDGIPAREWLFDYVGIQNHEVPLTDELLTHFPIVIENGCSSRFLQYLPDKKTVRIHHETSLPTGTKFKKGCISPNYTLKNTHRSLLSVLDTPVESLFLFACFFRKIYLSNCIRWELKPFENFNVCGMFAMGEIVFTDGENRLHHGASVFMGIAERETYIVPNMDELLNTQLIDEAIDSLAKSVENASPKKPEDFKQTLSPIQKYQQEHDEYYIDVHLNIPNMYQFKKDIEVKEYKKICIVEAETADIIIAFAGQDTYYEMSKQVIARMKRTFSKNCGEVQCYGFNYKTIFLACGEEVSDEDFKNYCKKLHEEFEHITDVKEDVTLALRFVVVVNTSNLMEEGIKFLFENKNNKDTFLVCDGDRVVENSDMHMVNIIKWALDHDKVIPYYQGLYHNEKKVIDKYEALMRIEDKDGKVYTPYFFLDLAKEYNFYNKISMRMVERTLDEFRNRSEKISLNLSLSDVQAESFRSWFLNQLEDFPIPENITIEILESDDFKNDSMFLDFLREVKSIGCKIAVDDFGTGYSTFVTISEIEPDYIKIDGSVIKHIDTDEKCLALLDAMAYFSSKMKALTVAEFVENAQIQEVLTGFDITYSQGYYFSKPSPIEDLDGQNVKKGS